MLMESSFFELILFALNKESGTETVHRLSERIEIGNHEMYRITEIRLDEIDLYHSQIYLIEEKLVLDVVDVVIRNLLSIRTVLS